MFPLYVAAIDVGSNAIRLVAAEFDAPGRYRVVGSERFPVRLGTDAFGAGAFSPETLDAAVQALRALRRRIDQLGVTHFRAVATSAVRESSNAAELVERAWREAGVPLEVIDGEEEARLGWRSARERLASATEPWAMMDLGGGSVEVSLVEGERVEWSRSDPYGSVRLLAEIADDAGTRDEVRRRLEPLAREVEKRVAALARPPAGLAASGGSIDALAALAGVATAAREPTVLPLDALRELIARLSSLTVAERVEQLKLPPDRADVVLLGAAVYERIAEAVGVDRLHVTGSGLKEGVAMELADSLVRRRTSEAQATRVAFVSDVHANVLALRAALLAADRAGAAQVVVAGDLVGEGPHPVEVARMLRLAGIPAIRGNVDRKVLKLAGKKKKKLRRFLEEWPERRLNRAWSALELRIAKEEHAWLESLPTELRLEVAGVPVLVVHGSPLADDDRIFSSLTPEALAAKLEPLDGWRPAVLVCGHTHAPFVATVDGVLVANCGSAGRPADGDPRGTLVVADLDGPDGPRAELLRFQYPVEALIHDAQESGVPGIDPEQYRQGVKL